MEEHRVELATTDEVSRAPVSTIATAEVRGVYRSRDRGATWEPVRSGMDSQRVDLVAVDPSDPDVLYAAVPTATFSIWTILKSTDRGATWFVTGDRVQVQGQRAEMSFCQQGTTIDVRRYRTIG